MMCVPRRISHPKRFIMRRYKFNLILNPSDLASMQGVLQLLTLAE